MKELLSNLLFQQYLDLLLKWNKTYRLTAVEDPFEIRTKHFEDSLAPLPFLPSPCRLLDIGTGAGFPGVPLKIANPKLEVVLLDSGRKKIAFCEALIRELNLSSIVAKWGRAEDQKIVKELGLFDVVISRATLPLSDFLEAAHPFLNETGLAIAMKGQDWRQEFQEKEEWTLESSFDYELSQGSGKRSLLFFEPKKF